MDTVDLRQKSWFLPYLRDVRDRFDPEATARDLSEFTDLPGDERFSAWRTWALQTRGLLQGAPTRRWPLPEGGLTERNRAEWSFLNTLAHQIELLAELRLVLGGHLESVAEQLSLCTVLAAQCDDLDTAETFYELGLEDWGDENDPRRDKLAKEMGPPARSLGQRLQDAARLKTEQPMFGLPFHHLLRYAHTCQLLELGRLHFTTAGRLDDEAARRIIAKGHVDKVHLIDALVALAQADRKLTSVERRIIDNAMDMARLPEDERNLINASMDQPATPAELARHITDPLTRHFIYTQIMLHSLLEGEPNDAERQFTTQLADALEFDEDERLALEAEGLACLESNPELVDAFSLGSVMGRYRRHITSRVESAVKVNMGRLVTEIRETGELGTLLAKRASGKLSPEEERKVRDQLTDICKTIPALAIFAVPGGSVLLPILIKLLPFDVLPTAFSDKNEKI